MLLNVAYEFLPKRRSLNTCFVMDHFGVDFEQGRHVIAENLELDLHPGDLAIFTGPSGSGKSSLLRAAATQLAASGDRVVWIDRLALPDQPLVDALPLPVRESLDLLSACGLSEAQLLLRTPGELSDGQRYRFRLAMGLAAIGSRQSALGHTKDESAPAASRLPIADSRKPSWLVADEFSAALDRTLAKVLAFNLRRLAARTGVGFLLATTHEDIQDDLAPDVVVRCDLDGTTAIGSRQSAVGQTNEEPVSSGRKPAADGRQPARAISFFPSCGSARAPRPTGRISLGGIIAATTSAPSSG